MKSKIKITTWVGQYDSIYRLNSNSAYEIVGEPGPISYDIIDLLDKYNLIVGISSVKVNKEGTFWEFKNHYYSTEEVDRMIKIKVFA